MAPSPLSQSTSAINLPSQQPTQPEIKLPRKLSKRKTTNVTTVFQDPPVQEDSNAISTPAPPMDHLPASPPDVGPSMDFPSKRMTFSPSIESHMSSPPPTFKREKRVSMLNRLARKFSILKKGFETSTSGNDGRRNAEAQSAANAQHSTIGPEIISEKSLASIPPTIAPMEQEPVSAQDKTRTSFSSLEISYSVMGKLTIANPDPYGEEIETPDVSQDISSQPLAPKTEESLDVREEAFLEGSSQPAVGSTPTSSPQAMLERVQTFVDKPLPLPQLTMPRFSRLVISDIIPQVIEQPLPPLPPKDTKNAAVSPAAREVTPPSPKIPEILPERPSSPETQHIIYPIPMPNMSISLDHTAQDLNVSLSPPRQAQSSPQRLKPSPSPHNTASPVKETPETPYSEGRRTQSPPAEVTTRRMSPNQSLSHQRSSNRNDASEAALVSKQQYAVRPSVSSQASYENRERPSEVTRTPVKTRSSSRPEPFGDAAPEKVPFPSMPHRMPSDSPNGKGRYIDSPMSASSMLANPPTPGDNRRSISGSDLSSVPPTLPPKSVRHQTPPPLPRGTSPTTRQTETFKLVRSSSGDVYASSQTILVQGQQWEVVESVDVRRRERSTRSRDRENERSRDHERERERDLQRERERERESELEREREREEQEIEHERERERERERAREEKERERQKVREKEREERERESEREREKGREERERERMIREKERAREEREKERALEKERIRKREKEREREREKERERHRQRDHDKDREMQRQQEKDRERERLREKERVREKEKDREKRKERERREREKERERERERRKEREREKEREKEREGKKEREMERAKGKERERDRETDRYRDGNYERKPRDYDRKSRVYEHRSRDYEPWANGLERGSREEGRLREPERRREERYYEKGSSRHVDDSRFNNGRSRTDENRSSRKQDDYNSTKHVAETSSSSHQLSQSLPIEAVEPRSLRLERNPSITARPTSQLASADEMNAIRAKEQWELERLWKARSLYGNEPNAAVTDFIPGPGSRSSSSDDIPDMDPTPPIQIYGSSHTAYVVPTPFHNQIYHSMPTAPPPIIYSSRASIPSIPDSLSSYEPYENLRSYPGPAYATASTSIPLQSPKSNPLPEPPRESSYLPALSTISPSKQRSTEYWTYNGITTAH